MFRLKRKIKMSCTEKKSDCVDLLFTWENINAYCNKSEKFFIKKWFVKQKVNSYDISSSFAEEISNEINLNSFITNVCIESNSIRSNDKLCREEKISTSSDGDALSNKPKKSFILSNSELRF